MPSRFRFLASDGREIDVGTLDDLVRLVRSGKIQSETLLYDSQAGGWAPARHNAAFLGALQPPSEESVTAPPRTSERRPERGGARTLEMPSMEYSFHEPEPVRAEDAVAQLLRERTDEASHDAANRSADMVATNSQAKEWTRWVSNDVLARPAVEASASPRRPAGKVRAIHAIPAAPKPRSRPAWYLVPVAVGALGLASLNGLFSRETQPPAVSDATLPGIPASTRMSAAQGLLGGSLRQSVGGGGATEEAAFDGMLEEMRALESRYHVDQVPAVWLEGRYLADANRFPEVIRYWLKYEDYVQEMRAREGDFFHANLIRELESEGLSGSSLSLRLARATRAFEEGAAGRDSVYTAMLELSSAAVAFHALLVEHTSQISYEPATSGVSRNPVLEAVIDDNTVNLEVHKQLAVVLSAMERAYGRRIEARTQLPSALQRGLLLKEADPR